MSTVTSEGPILQTDIATLTGRQDLAIKALLNQRPYLAHLNPQRITRAVECQGCGDKTVYLSRQDLEFMHLE